MADRSKNCPVIYLKTTVLEEMVQSNIEEDFVVSQLEFRNVVSNMADMSKSEKLAAARKRLKEYQQKGKESHTVGNKPPGKKVTSRLQHEVEESSSLEQNSVFDSGPAIEVHTENVFNGEVKPQIISQSSVTVNEGVAATSTPENINEHFSINQDEVNIQELKELNSQHNGIIQETESHTFQRHDEVFAKVSQSFSPPIASFPSFTMSDSLSSNQYFSEIDSGREFFDNFSANVQNQLSSNEINQSLDIKETNLGVTDVTNPSNDEIMTKNEHLNVLNIPPQLNTNIFTNPEELNHHENSDAVSFVETEKIENTMESVALDTCIEEQQTQHEQDGTEIMEDVATSEPTVNIRSTSESLRQLSLQMNGLIDESMQKSCVNGEDSELECRNQELAAMLATEKQKTEQLELQLKEYQSRLSQLQIEQDQLRTESEARVTRELGPVQEQLQLHVQTVGILVGEKTELQAALTKSQNLAKQKAGEAEELQGRLKASRHKVAELEKAVSSLHDSNEKLEKTIHELSNKHEKLKQEQVMTSRNLEEKEEEVSELHQKLKTKTSDYLALQRELQEKQSQLSLAQVRIQQLSTMENSEMSGQLETLHQQNVSLEKQVAELQQTIKSVGSERDQASQQYQQYVQQLNGQLQSLVSKVESLSAENEHLVNREQSLVRLISDMEKQQQQTQKRRDSPPRPPPQDLAAMQEMEGKLAVLESEKQALSEKLNSQVQENENVKKELEERTVKIEELEMLLERLQGDQPDKDKLLAAMESDKIAAARAVGQNQRLKQQLEELQDGFVKMSNDKLELTEHLQHEHHICKEQGERLAQQEDELKELRKQLMEKEHQLQKNSTELTNQMLQHSQIADRMRHYEANGQLHEILQQELEQAKDRIQALSTQNNELRTLLAQQTTHDSGSSSGAGSLEDTLSRKDEMLATLSASVRQLEHERDKLLEQLNQNNRQDKQNSQETDRETALKEYESMKKAMEQLEERFTKTMKEVADLSDEKQRLEHLVLQLQGETETIGEYIALYQVQRSILRQRAQEKDEQLSKLNKDREEMRNKLLELNELVRQLVAEKEAVRKLSHSSLIEHRSEEPMSELHMQQLEAGVPNGEIVEVEVGKEVNGDTSQPAVEEQADTAGKIMALLSEIGTSSLVDPQCSENFHPCPWCSGRLITV